MRRAQTDRTGAHIVSVPYGMTCPTCGLFPHPATPHEPTEPALVRSPTFTRPCGDASPHAPHDYVKYWAKLAEEPLGWFPPGSYADMPDEGWDAAYKCRGDGDAAARAI